MQSEALHAGDAGTFGHVFFERVLRLVCRPRDTLQCRLLMSRIVLSLVRATLHVVFRLIETGAFDGACCVAMMHALSK